MTAQIAQSKSTTHVVTPRFIRDTIIPHGFGCHTVGGYRGECTCGWFSDCYAQLSDTERAAFVHLRRASQADFEGLIERSSIGAGIADIKERGIEKHLEDLEKEMRPRRKKAKRSPVKPMKEADVAFMRGFGCAIASIWRCQHDGHLVQMLIKENGFTLASFQDVGMLAGDYDAICQAMRSRHA